ncbi:putative sterigmatocystin biosynthesis protein stcT [Cercospora beticola]|uniref:Putative sterigmatocystin biosynthesis protein stcT n=1 Tax=Cercospora beticola TaxID=122368 RepID=A0A2G5I470_CERBT|nr:putative sterigmatocystin biosynthesis protein stcT [Cercospora beticola]PIA99570.1 putative sterigmatocystin biosynthesis protein stcT [Cercospora beticola]
MLISETQFNPRTPAILAVAKSYGLDLATKTIVSAEDASDEYLDLNPLGKIPTLVAANGFVVSECIAVALYVASQKDDSTLLGDSKEDYASIVRWISFANMEILLHLGGWFNPIIGRRPFVQAEVDESMKQTNKRMDILEKHLEGRTYLVGDRLSLADMFVTGVVAGGFMFFFDQAWRESHPNVTRWFLNVYEQPIYAGVAGKAILVEKARPNAPPRPRQAEEAPRSAAQETNRSIGVSA